MCVAVTCHIWPRVQPGVSRFFSVYRLVRGRLANGLQRDIRVGTQRAEPHTRRSTKTSRRHSKESAVRPILTYHTQGNSWHYACQTLWSPGAMLRPSGRYPAPALLCASSLNCVSLIVRLSGGVDVLLIPKNAPRETARPRSSTFTARPHADTLSKNRPVLGPFSRGP